VADADRVSSPRHLRPYGLGGLESKLGGHRSQDCGEWGGHLLTLAEISFWALGRGVTLRA
jgi:hypothetical protein